MIKFKIVITISLFLSSSLPIFSQIGINTDAPDSFIHMKTLSTGADLRIDNQGNIGLSMNPLVKLSIDTKGTTSTPIPGFILKDGSEKNDRILVCDANGTGIWKDVPLLRKVTAAKGAGVTLNYTTAGVYVNTGTTITVPPGTWMIHTVMTLSKNASAPNESVWVRSTFANQGMLTPSPDIQGSQLISGLGWKNTYSLVQGFIIIKNTSNIDKVYDYIAGATENNGGFAANFIGFGGGWNEDNIVGYQIELN